MLADPEFADSEGKRAPGTHERLDGGNRRQRL
jgi:hypothetical protein